jgi:hypothetical protein
MTYPLSVFWLSACLLVASSIPAQASSRGVEAKSAHAKVSHRIGRHGGRVSRIHNIDCEVVPALNSVRVYLSQMDGAPIPVHDLRGVVKLKRSQGAKTYRYELYPEGTRTAETNALYVPFDRATTIPGESFSGEIVIYNLPGYQHRPVRFAHAIDSTNRVDGVIASNRSICPVSGQPLGSMGSPVSIRIQGQDVSLCCRGCVRALKKNPRKYLTRAASARPRPTTRSGAGTTAR